MAIVLNASERPSRQQESRQKFEPETQFRTNKRYEFKLRSSHAKTPDLFYAKFIKKVQGDRWISHYLFNIGGVKQSFTQIQLMDYEIKEV